MSTASDPGFGLYIHWPFCRSKCPYCDFNSHVRERIDNARWQRALLAELDHFADLMGAGLTAPRPLTSIFFGGGTPSLMDPAITEALIARARARWGFDAEIEITLEANPTSIEAGRFAGFRAAGVNRVSIGVQAFDDSALAFLGRQHSAGEARAAVALAQRHFQRVSFDLIYGRPGQDPSAWRGELETALAFGTEHLSLYQLTIEPNTAFEGRVRRGELVPLDEEPAAELYEITQGIMERAGLPAYEISNYARPGAQSRHNLTYWRYGDYLGIGPGAHGRITLNGEKLATRQHRAPEAWLERVEAAGHATSQQTVLEAQEQRAEMIMMGLRLTDGLDEARLEAMLGRDRGGLIEARRLAPLVAGGFLERGEGRLRATAAGRQRLDAVIGALIA